MPKAYLKLNRNVNIYVGVAIRQRRVRLGMTQMQVATAAGIQRPALTLMELGKQEITLAYLYAISEVLQCEPTYFMPGLEVARFGMGEWSELENEETANPPVAANT